MLSLCDIVNPGSFSIGVSFNTLVNINNMLIIFWQLDHPSPFHVFNTDKHTFPSIYKFGLNRVEPSLVKYVTNGGSNGYFGGNVNSNK